jgi:hypothetical protein
MHVLGMVFAGWVMAAVPIKAQGDSSAAVEWQEQATAFTYKGGSLVCELSLDGGIKSIDAEHQRIFSDVVLHGSYLGGAEKHDSRFFQGWRDDAPTPLRFTKDGENGYTFRKEGVLKNDKHPDGGAKFAETVAFSPNRIELAYEVEQLVELSANAHVFSTLLYLPVETYGSRGCIVTAADGTTTNMIFPARFVAARPLQVLQAAEMKVSLITGVLAIKPGENTSINALDCRSWDGEGFRLDLKETVPWQESPAVFPAGKKFRWSFVMTFTPHNP